MFCFTLSHTTVDVGPIIYFSLVFLVQFVQRIHKQHVLYSNSSVFVLNVFMSVYATHWLRFDWRIVFESRSLLCCCYCCCFAFFTHRMIFVCYFTIDEHCNIFFKLQNCCKIRIPPSFTLLPISRSAPWHTRFNGFLCFYTIQNIYVMFSYGPLWALSNFFDVFEETNNFFLFWTIFNRLGLILTRFLLNSRIY